MCRRSSSISRPANWTRRCGRGITKTIRCFAKRSRTGSTSSGSKRISASTRCAPRAAESAASAPDPALNIKTAADLSGKKVGVGLGTNYEQWVRANVPGADVRTYDDDPTKFADLNNGRTDADRKS